MIRSGGDDSQLRHRVRSVLGDHRLVAKSPEGSQQTQTLNWHFAWIAGLINGLLLLVVPFRAEGWNTS